jgi:hypothetical protein
MTSSDSWKNWCPRKVRSYSNFLDATPNIDFFTREELKEIVEKFKHEINNGELDDSSRLS